MVVETMWTVMLDDVYTDVLVVVDEKDETGDTEVLGVRLRREDPSHWIPARRSQR